MRKGNTYVIIGIVIIAIGVTAFFMLTQDQTQDQTQVQSEISSPQVIPQIPKQTSESSDKIKITVSFDIWAEKSVTFMDSNDHIPKVTISQNWANGDALLACSMIVEDPTILDVTEEFDLNWCREFLKTHMIL